MHKPSTSVGFRNLVRKVVSALRSHRVDCSLAEAQKLGESVCPPGSMHANAIKSTGREFAYSRVLDIQSGLPNLTRCSVSVGSTGPPSRGASWNLVRTVTSKVSRPWLAYVQLYPCSQVRHSSTEPKNRGRW